MWLCGYHTRTPPQAANASLMLWKGLQNNRSLGFLISPLRCLISLTEKNKQTFDLLVAVKKSGDYTLAIGCLRVTNFLIIPWVNQIFIDFHWYDGNELIPNCGRAVYLWLSCPWSLHLIWNMFSKLLPQTGRYEIITGAHTNRVWSMEIWEIFLCKFIHFE